MKTQDRIRALAQLKYSRGDIIEIIKIDTGEVISFDEGSDNDKAYKRGIDSFNLMERSALRKKSQDGDLSAINRLKELSLDPMDQIFYKYKPK